MLTEKKSEKLGRYEILAVLGQGAMGIVYKAIDPLIDRTVAIKTINLDLSRDELANFEERFYREAKSAGRLNHPNIVTIHDVGKSANVAYMAMEFLEGQVLRDILDVHTALSIDQIVDITTQIAEGLAYAHENGIVHRDIKPANIMLVRDGIAKITDFGIAQTSTGTRTLAGTVLGSPKYMSPEQVLGQPVDGRSDLFSLGVVFYEMLTGEPPFTGENINATMYRILNETPVPPKMLAPRIPEVFNQIVAKLLAKNPDERYQSATDLSRDLKDYKNLSPLKPGNLALDSRAGDNPITSSRNRVGEETVLLRKPNSALDDTKQQFASETQTIQKDTAAFNFGGANFWQNKKILIPSILVLLISFTVIVTLGKPAQPEKIPLQAIAATPVQTAQPFENRIQIIPASSDGVLLQQPDVAALPPEATVAMSPEAVPAPAPLVRKQAPVRRETSKSVPASVKPAPVPVQTEAKAILSFAITPWGDIYVDGKKIGASPPLTEYTLPAGKHTIEIRNSGFAPYSQTMDLQADTTSNIKYIFK